jgi:hypothetical protein
MELEREREEKEESFFCGRKRREGERVFLIGFCGGGDDTSMYVLRDGKREETNGSRGGAFASFGRQKLDVCMIMN